MTVFSAHRVKEEKWPIPSPASSRPTVILLLATKHSFVYAAAQIILHVCCLPSI